ncbi:hypothetical protein K0C01_00130 [Salinarchaeum sp. IM2453]|uniref:sensor histidine kinase n=1 Tax=Salinarchaeum sp. IM2453 TaxID=2862870 RepID=UPI001C83986D|nr:histidine kinase N-terminal 7TM domain-containing protein [Salinarchaeum sp. IM2453]QZA88624.1 hypothetical protein K0C01_00130 [Salinarchaeum sp. IM2453]
MSEMQLLIGAFHVGPLLLSLALGIYIWRHFKGKPIGQTFSLFMFALSVWVIGTFLRTFTTSPEVYLFLSSVKHIGTGLAPVLFTVFAIYFAGRSDVVTPTLVLGLLVVPALSVIMILTSQTYGLFYQSISTVGLNGETVLQTASGIWYWVHGIYGWTLLAVGSTIIIYTGLQLGTEYRAQASLITAGIMVAWIVNLGYVIFEWPHPTVDPTPIGFAFTGLVIAVGIFSRDLFAVAPVSRSRVVDRIADIILVVDENEQVLDANETAEEILEQETVVGEPVDDVLPSQQQRAGKAIDAEDRDVVTIEGRVFREQEVPVTVDPHADSIVVLTDITEEVRAQEQLAQQNERLDAFASVVSHDLRNPLNVLSGSIELARETGEMKHLERGEKAIERMDEMIEDLLMLAREGQRISGVEPAPLSVVTKQAWGAVETGEASLQVETDRTIKADSSRLQQLFENLFRNAIEHGSADTVVVDTTQDGFYVADDGTGIDAEQKDHLFEMGYSTVSAGTGLGLSIVEAIATGHGWKITVDEGESGGAKFVFSDVELQQSEKQLIEE